MHPLLSGSGSTLVEMLAAHAELETRWLAWPIPTEGALKQDLVEALAKMAGWLPPEDDDLMRSIWESEAQRDQDEVRRDRELGAMSSFSRLCADIAFRVSRLSPLLSAYFLRQACCANASFITDWVDPPSIPFHELVETYVGYSRWSMQSKTMTRDLVINQVSRPN